MNDETRKRLEDEFSIYNIDNGMKVVVTTNRLSGKDVEAFRKRLKNMNTELDAWSAGILYKGMTKAGDDEAKELDD